MGVVAFEQHGHNALLHRMAFLFLSHDDAFRFSATSVALASGFRFKLLVGGHTVRSVACVAHERAHTLRKPSCKFCDGWAWRVFSMTPLRAMVRLIVRVAILRFAAFTGQIIDRSGVPQRRRRSTMNPICNWLWLQILKEI